MAERKKEVAMRWIVGYVSTSQWLSRCYQRVYKGGLSLQEQTDVKR